MNLSRPLRCGLSVLLMCCTALPASANDSTLDPGFGIAGERTLSHTPPLTDRDSQVFAVLRDAQGRLLVLASRRRDLVPEPGRDLDLLLYRLSPDGALDTTFGSGRGFVLREFAWTDFSTARLDAEGKILLVGTVVSSAGFAVTSLSLARLLPDGSRDPSFDSGIGSPGIFSFSIGSDPENRATAVTILPGGDLLLSGQLRTSGSLDFFAIRLAGATGTPVGSWGESGGLRIVDLQPTAALADDRPAAVVALPDGRVLLLGQSCTTELGCRPAAVRLNISGGLDNSFCASAACIAASLTGVNSGRVVLGELPSNDYNLDAMQVSQAGMDDTGRMVLIGAGSSSGGAMPDPLLLTALGPDGAPDLSFGQQGLQVLALADASVQASALALDANGRWLIGGRSTTDASSSHAMLARVRGNGQPDPNFAAGGIARYFPAQGAADRHIRAVLPGEDRIWAAGDRIGPNNRDAFIIATALGLFADGFE